jgi:TrpR-related protein YerC/YecD
MNDKDLIKYSDDIITVLSKLDKKSEVFNFVRDLLSEKEITEFSRRFEVAKMLDKKISYSLIEEKTNMSSTTIARISKFLK